MQKQTPRPSTPHLETPHTADEYGRTLSRVELRLLGTLWVCAIEAATHSSGVPTGRSRTAALRRLAAAVDAIKEYDRSCR